jgi:hypothetical protein
LLPDDQVHPDTHVLTMVNNVIGVVNYVIAARPSLLNFMIADTPFDSLRPGQTLDSCLGVKGSPVQIRPSRPEGPGQKGFRVLTRAPLRSSGANRRHLTPVNASG